MTEPATEAPKSQPENQPSIAPKKEKESEAAPTTVQSKSEQQ